jgi:hypothetical protein
VHLPKYSRILGTCYCQWCGEPCASDVVRDVVAWVAEVCTPVDVEDVPSEPEIDVSEWTEDDHDEVTLIRPAQMYFATPPRGLRFDLGR